MLAGKYNQQGGFLVGVLIAMVVAGIGLFALLQVNGKMTSGISASKARAEAMQWAQHKSQELSAAIETGQHDLYFTSTRSDWDTPSAPDDTKEGKNASFEQKWWIRDASDGGNYKQLLVRVSWTDEAGKPQNVSLNNFVVFKDPATISGIWSDVTGESPEPPVRTRMNVGIEKEEDGTSDTPRDGSDPVDEDGPTDLYTGINSKGNWEIYTETGVNANVVLTAFGGIIHRISGTIYLDPLATTSLSDVKVFATSPAYCHPINTATGEYDCFIPGDCSNEKSEEAPFVGANFDCQFDETGKLSGENLTTHLTNIKDLNLNGGWHGKIGLTGVVLTPFNDICTGNVGEVPPGISGEHPAREYVSYRLISSSIPPIPPVPLSCKYREFCGFGDSILAPPYTGYISHCVTITGKDIEYIDGWCDGYPDVGSTTPPVIPPDTLPEKPYAIIANQGINTPYTNHDFLIVKKDDVCEARIVNFVSIIDNPVRIAPNYIVRPVNAENPLINVRATNAGRLYDYGELVPPPLP